MDREEQNYRRSIDRRLRELEHANVKRPVRHSVGGGGSGALPAPQYPLMVYQGVAHNVGGFDWVRYAPLSAPTEP